MGVEVLVQIDRLVQLLETPIFTYLRLQLLQPARYPDLIRCLPPPATTPHSMPHSSFRTACLTAFYLTEVRIFTLQRYAYFTALFSAFGTAFLTVSPHSTPSWHSLIAVLPTAAPHGIPLVPSVHCFKALFGLLLQTECK